MKTVDVEIDNRIVKIIIEFDETNNEMNYVELCLRMDIPNTDYTMVKKLDSHNVEFDYDGNYTEQSRKRMNRIATNLEETLKDLDNPDFNKSWVSYVKSNLRELIRDIDNELEGSNFE
tara:strand:+ start:633 stop:986 length:354 start_codon:yes stop_codon:yes gene_type:complete